MHLKPYGFLSTIPAAGTRKRLTTSGIEVLAVTIQAKLGNTGIVYIGDNQVSSTNYGHELLGGDSVSMNAVNRGSDINLIKLNEIWLDTNSNNDQVAVSSWREVD